MTDFPTLDADRTNAIGRHIIDNIGVIEPHLCELDTWCSMSIRLVTDQGAGICIEIGPYSLNTTDINVLRAAINAYDQTTR